MNKVKDKIVRCIFFCFIFFFLMSPINALTKDDIFDLVNSQKTCDGSSSVLFQSYSKTYTRLVKEKDLSESEIKSILNHLNTAIDLLNKKEVCKLSDTSKLTSEEKRTVFNSLVEGSNIITSAKNLVDEKQDNKNSGIVIDKADKKIEIYDQGQLVNELSLEKTKLTYTGPSIQISIIFVLLLIVLFLIKFIKPIILKDMLISLGYTLFIILIVSVIFSKDIKEISNYFNLFKKISSNQESKKIVTKDKSIIRYPRYGDTYGNLYIPNLGIKLEVAFGDNKELLNKYIGHDTATLLPGEGGTIVYSGHNSKDFLNNLKDIKKETSIIVETTYGTFNYKVNDTKIIDDTDFDSVYLKGNKEVLVLYTCYPFSNFIYGSKRMVVYATLEDSDWLGDSND